MRPSKLATAEKIQPEASAPLADGKYVTLTLKCYVTGSERLRPITFTAPCEHINVLVLMTAFTLTTFFFS